MILSILLFSKASLPPQALKLVGFNISSILDKALKIPASSVTYELISKGYHSVINLTTPHQKVLLLSCRSCGWTAMR